MTPVKLGALAEMAINVSTKDSTALADSDVAEMADLCALVQNGYEIGVLSKQAEEWVLATLSREEGVLTGFAFSTLERIGGTPAVLLGLVVVDRREDGADILAALMRDQMRRAVLAFPDEDVLVGSRLASAVGFDAFADLIDHIPRPDHKASGEERAWGRRLAKRFRIETSAYEDRTFRAKGDGSVSCVLDYQRADSREQAPEIAAFFADLDVAAGDALIGFGWAMAEYLDGMNT